MSVVIPTLNEELNLPFVLPRIGTWIDEVIIVDGRSTDNTPEVARELLPGVRIVHERRSGKGAALRAGFAACSCDLIIMLDADGSTDPREIPLFVGALAAGAEFVKGTRFAQGAGTEDMWFLRRFGNRALVSDIGDLASVIRKPANHQPVTRPAAGLQRAAVQLDQRLHQRHTEAAGAAAAERSRQLHVLILLPPL